MKKYKCSGLNILAENIFNWSKKHGFRTDWLNVPENLMQIVTELSEAMQEYKSPKMERIKFDEEMADAVIRLLCMMFSLNIDIENEIEKKMMFNEKRPYRNGKLL